MPLNPPDLRPDRAPAPRADRGRPPRPAPRRHGQPRLPEGAGRHRAHPDPPARRGLRDLARLRRRRGGDRQHLRLPRLGQGREPRGDRRGPLPPTAASSSPAASAPTRQYIRGTHPSVLAVTGPHQYEAVLDAVHAAVPPAPDPFVDLLPASAVHLTPRHYSYLKISEGCNHKCRFCIIPDMRGRLVSRPAHAVLREAEKLVAAGVRELLVISQDTSRLRHRPPPRRPPVAGPQGPHPHHRPRPRARQPRRLGPPALRLPLPPRPRPDPADGRRPDPPLPRHPVPALPPGRAAPHGPPRRLGEDPRRDRPLARRLPRPHAALDLHRRLPRRDRGRVRSTCSTGSTRPGSTASAPSSTRTSPAPAPTPSPTTSPRRSSRTAGTASWRRPAPSAPRSSPPRSAPARRSSSTRSTPRPPPAAPRATRPRSTATSSSTKGFEALKPGDILTVEVDEADDYDLWGSIRR